MSYGKSQVKIVVLQRGWVYVGNFTKDGSICTITDGYNVRAWGTQKGLGELALGPTRNSVLDPVPPVSFNELTMVSSIDCVDGWLEMVKLDKIKS